MTESNSNVNLLAFHLSRWMHRHISSIVDAWTQQHFTCCRRISSHFLDALFRRISLMYWTHGRISTQPVKIALDITAVDIFFNLFFLYSTGTMIIYDRFCL